MINAKLSYSTKNVDINNKKYCLYCGKEIQPDTEIDHHESYNYYHCDCKDALKEIKIRNEIINLESKIRFVKQSLPKEKFAIKKEEIYKLVKA